MAATIAAIASMTASNRRMPTDSPTCFRRPVAFSTGVPANEDDSPGYVSSNYEMPQNKNPNSFHREGLVVTDEEQK
jgi:hypothetical protein